MSPVSPLPTRGDTGLVAPHPVQPVCALRNRSISAVCPSTA